MLTEAHVAGASDVAWLLGDSVLAVALHGRGVTLLETATGAERGTWRLANVPAEAAFGLAASASGETLAVALSDSVRVFRTRGLVPLLATAGRALSLALSGDGTSLRWSDGATGRSIAVPSGEVRLEAPLFAKRGALRWVPFLGGFAWPEERLVRFERDDSVAAMSLGPVPRRPPRAAGTLCARLHRGGGGVHGPRVVLGCTHRADALATPAHRRGELRRHGALGRHMVSGDCARRPRATAVGLHRTRGRRMGAARRRGGAFARIRERRAPARHGGRDDRVRVWAVPKPRRSVADMCGIAGWYARGGRAVPEGTIGAMCDTIVHRGPDDQGRLTDGDFGFGMRRLAIVDVAGGHQPMTSEDGRHVVTFNGEIFNHPALRRELEALGHRYRTNSDTESILRGFQQWGPGVWAKLEGMFAVAIWIARRARCTWRATRSASSPCT
jgi:hypothetical protein